MAGVERFSKTARQYDSGKSPTLDPTTDAVKKLAWVRRSSPAGDASALAAQLPQSASETTTNK